MGIYYRIKDLYYEFVQKCQRFKKGYSNSDVYSFSDWFLNILPKMIRHLKKNHHGYPIIGDDGEITWTLTQPGEVYEQRWMDILDQIIIFAEEASESKCSMKNPYYDEWWRYYKAFDRKYPDKDVLKTEEELKSEQETHTYYHVSPERDPENGEKYKEISQKMCDYEYRINDYRTFCKDQLFELLKRYFWTLGD